MAEVHVSGDMVGCVVVAGDGNQLLVQPPSASSPSMPPLPCADDRLFVGRQAELQHIALALKPQTEPGDRGPLAAIVGVRGIGGVGKTALARQFAQVYQAEFAGGALWGNFGSNQDEGERGLDLNPLEVMREELLRWEAELGSQGDPERPWKVVLGSLRSLLSARQDHVGRCLLILDNIDHPDVLQPLREQLGFCSLLLTTRQAALVPTQPSQRIDLGGLARSDSHAYLRVTLGADSARLARMGPLLDYIEDHPLALKLLVAVLCDGSSLNEQTLFERLTQDLDLHGRHAGLVHIPASLADCFRVSIERLPRSRKRPLFACFISLASQAAVSFSNEAADYVSGRCEPKRTEALLRELRGLGLVEDVESSETGGARRYRVHRLLRDYVRHCYGRRGLGRLPSALTCTSTAYFLMRLCPAWPAGAATYDLRQELFFYRYAARHAHDPEALRRERDGLLLGVYRRADAGQRDALWLRLQVLRSVLSGADLSRLDTAGLCLDGAQLDEISLRNARLAGVAPASWRQLKSVLRMAALAAMPSIFIIVLWYNFTAIHALKALIINPIAIVIPGIIFSISMQITRRPDAFYEFFSDRFAEICRAPLWAITWAAVGGSLGFTVVLLQAIYRHYLAPSPAVSVGFVLLSVHATQIIQIGGYVGALYGVFAALQGSLVRLCQRSGLGNLGFYVVSAVLWLLAIGLLPGGRSLAAVGIGLGLSLLATPDRLSLFEKMTPTGRRWTRSYLRRTSLRRADLHGVDLRWARLQGADLTGADLSSARLDHARLDGAILSQANLSQARLNYASLVGASLQGANLAGADLRDADLQGSQTQGIHSDTETRWPDSPRTTVPVVVDENLLAERSAQLLTTVIGPGFVDVYYGRPLRGLAWLLAVSVAYLALWPVGLVVHAACLICVLWIAPPSPVFSPASQPVPRPAGRSLQRAVFSAGLSFLVPGLGQLFARRWLSGILWMIITCFGYVCFIVPGVLLHVICVYKSAKLYWGVLQEVNPSVRPRKHSTSVVLMFLLLVFPGFLHIYRRQYAIGILLLISTLCGYFCFFIPGIIVHIGCLSLASKLLTHISCPFCEELVALDATACCYCHEHLDRKPSAAPALA